LVQPHAGQVHLRGDTDFSLTGKFDEWDQAGVTFNLGMDASAKLVALAQSLSEAQRRGLARAATSAANRVIASMVFIN
jgi:hypothetical protein